MNLCLTSACLALAMAGCAPRVSTLGEASTRPPAKVTATRPLPRPPQAPQGRGPTLPASVVVELTRLTGATEIRWSRPGGRPGLAEQIGGRVFVNGAPAAAPARVDGPLVIDGRTYDGTLLLSTCADGGLTARIDVGLEAYVEGVVASETSIWSAAAAELEAQAIAARTYAVATLQQRAAGGTEAQLADGVMDQAFQGRHVPGSSARAREAADRLTRAVRATAGVVLLRGDRLEEARYHAACGGHTSAFRDVFRKEVRERDARGPTGTPCTPCARRAAQESMAGAPDATRPLGWIEELSPSTLARVGRAFGLPGAPRRIGPARTDAGGRWLDVALESNDGAVTRVPFEAFRKVVGYSVLRSGALVATVPNPSDPLLGGGWRAQGRGRGHGVGLCQEGSRDLSRAGWTSADILAHYYPGATLSRPLAGDASELAAATDR
ncbi:MAG: SpoIID/LytB domain-containing protein [Planctomycetota bacterium]|nr:SpoIID/LytB domain-containing protein [Planctomycetota bacterium]